MNAPPDEPVIATRNYRTAQGAAVVARLQQPTLEGDHWVCSFTISGLGDEIRDRGHGMDGLQAVIVALSGIRFHLQKSGEVLQMDFDGELGEPGVLGIEKGIPDTYGVEIEKQLIDMVEKESTRLIHEHVAGRREKKGR
jgi:hypothetical protein